MYKIYLRIEFFYIWTDFCFQVHTNLPLNLQLVHFCQLDRARGNPDSGQTMTRMLGRYRAYRSDGILCDIGSQHREHLLVVHCGGCSTQSDEAEKDKNLKFTAVKSTSIVCSCYNANTSCEISTSIVCSCWNVQCYKFFRMKQWK